jgi:hypothetical protein
MMAEQFGRSTHVVDRVRRRICQISSHEHVHSAIERRREQQALRFAWRLIEDAHHGRHEPEIGHVIGLVENVDPHFSEPAVSLGDEVLKTSRRRDNDV